MKTIGILGSTGSIGTQSLDVAQKQGYTVSVLTAGSNDFSFILYEWCYDIRS